VWRFIVTDRSGVAFGELTGAAYDRKLRLALNGVATGSFRTRMDHPLNEALLDAGATMVKVYDGETLRCVGPIVSFDEAGGVGGGTIAYTFADGGWRWAKRHIGKDLTGAAPYKNPSTGAGSVDSGQIAKDLIDLINAESPTGIEVGASYLTGIGNRVGPWQFKPLLEAIADLSGPIDGFDWQITPKEPAAGIIGTFNCYPAIGIAASNAVFEFGMGRENVESWKRIGNADSLMNIGYALPPSYPDVSQGKVQVSGAPDPDSLARYGLLEDVVPTDFAPDDMRLRVIQEHVRIRRAPRQTVSFEPMIGNAPVYGSDYSIGDVFPFRAAEVVDGEKQVRIDALLRLYAIEWNIDNNGQAKATLTVAGE
jgi:hypothetical protein